MNHTRARSANTTALSGILLFDPDKLSNIFDHQDYLEACKNLDTHYKQFTGFKSPHIAQHLDRIQSGDTTSSFDTGLDSLSVKSNDLVNYHLVCGSILYALYASTAVLIKSGDAVLSDVDAEYEVDYRLGVMNNSKFVDVANVEVGKHPSSTKIKEDYAKLVLEAETIMNRIINQFFFISPSSTKIVSLQIRDLKASWIHYRISTSVRKLKIYRQSSVLFVYQNQ